MLKSILKIVALISLATQLTACPSGGKSGADGPQGLPGKDVTEIANGSLELSKLKAASTDAGKFLSIENGAVVPKDAPSGDPPGTIVYKNSTGVVVAKRMPGSGSALGISGHWFGSLDDPNYLKAYGILASSTPTLNLVFSGSGCSGEARFSLGNSNSPSSQTLIGAVKSYAAGAAGSFYEVDALSGVRTDPFVAMSHVSGGACVETTVGGTTQNTTLIGQAYPGDPIVELGIVSAEVK